jgi:Tfp pilus assembly protein PilZ
MAMVDYTELREHLRVNVDLFADWGWGPECEYYDKITSLSLGGCFLATKRELRSGDQIYLKLSVESNSLITLEGAVRYQLRVMEGAPPTGAGVQFVGLSENAQTKIQMVMNFYKAV